MIIQIDDLGARLDEPQDFKHFHVSVSGPGLEVASSLVRDEIGRLHSDGDARVLVTAVRALARREMPDDADYGGWNIQFDEMLSFATSKGWMDLNGSEIRAHVEHGSP